MTVEIALGWRMSLKEILRLAGQNEVAHRRLTLRFSTFWGSYDNTEGFQRSSV
jgi:hypothetical protein